MKGYQHVSIADLEKASGKTKATLYGYFENKAQMASVVLSYNFEQKRQAIYRLSEERQTIKGKLLAHIEIHRPVHADRLVGGGCPILNAGVEVDDANDQLRILTADALTSWAKDITQLIDTGIKNDEFRKDINPAQTAWELISIIEGAIFISRTTQNQNLGLQLLDVAQIRVEQLVPNYTKASAQ